MIVTSASQFSLWLQLRKQNHITYAFLSEQHHAQAVDTDADATGGRHAVFEGHEEILVQFLLLAASLMLQRRPLRDRVVLLGVTGRNLLAINAALEDLDGSRVVGRQLGERHKFLWQMRDKGWLNQRGLDELLEHRTGDFEVFGLLAD